MTTTRRSAFLPPATEPRTPSDRVRPLVIGSAVLVLVLVAVRVAYRLTSPWIVEPYKAPLWWVTYDMGFVRRGLPGSVLAWSGPPTLLSMTVASVAIAVVACGALVALARRLAGLVDDPTTRVTVLVVVLASPFSLPLMIRDVGRYDAIGVAVIAGVAAISPRRARPGAMVMTAVSGALAIAAGSEEFLVAFAVPLVVALARRWSSSARTRGGLLVAMLGPALVVSIGSVAVRPDRGALLVASRATHSAGVLPADEVDIDAATVLGYSVHEQLLIFTEYPWPWLVVLLVGGAAVSGLIGLLVWIAVGRPRVAGAAGWLGSAALAMSVVGVDFLRWWGLALLGFLAFLAASSHSAPSDSAPSRSSRTAVPPAALVVVVLVWTLLWQIAPIGPPPR